MPVNASSLSTRLNQIPDRILSDDFLQGRGLGNEIGFYIFDYPPECELQVRAQLEVIENAIQARRSDLKVLTVNLFDVVVDYLRERKLLEKSIEMQRSKGSVALQKALEAPLKADKLIDFLTKTIDVTACDIIFLVGVGSAYPIVRSHSLLNNLHAVLGHKPLVLFFPGSYDGQGLRLFSRLDSDHYYRAFRLIA